MAHLIDKDALIAEIERLKDEYLKHSRNKSRAEQSCGTLDNILSSLNSLEVKEIDLEKALSYLDKDIKEFVTTEEFENESTTAGHYWVIAKHTFLLGLKAQKGETV